MKEDNALGYIDNKVYQEITALSVEHILRLHDMLGGFVFRGHAVAEWRLRTAFERAAEDVPPDQRTKLEQKVLVEFRRRAQHYLSDLPGDIRHLEWLALMQHHGCPTRLLDFTWSYFIGLFFAVEEANSDSSVWAVNRAFFEYRPGIPASDDHLYSTYNEDAERSVSDIVSALNEHEQESGVLLVEPCRMNERLSIQQGLFLFPKNLGVPFEKNLCSPWAADSLDELAKRDSRPAVVKIVVPSRLHLNIVGMLSEMNISAATLFPGLDGYARSQKLHIQSARHQIQKREAFFDDLWERLQRQDSSRRETDGTRE